MRLVKTDGSASRALVEFQGIELRPVFNPVGIDNHPGPIHVPLQIDDINEICRRGVSLMNERITVSVPRSKSRLKFAIYGRHQARVADRASVAVCRKITPEI